MFTLEGVDLRFQFLGGEVWKFAKFIRRVYHKGEENFSRGRGSTSGDCFHIYMVIKNYTFAEIRSMEFMFFLPDTLKTAC